MVRVARNSNSAVLLPFDKVVDNTSEFMLAVQHASTILSWYENLPEEETPPRWMWPFPDELDDWFEEVRLARNSGNDEWGGMEKNEWTPDD